MTVRLVYGLGATKAGSGWLYRYLLSHPECHLRAIKELHFFDAVEFGYVGARLRKLDRSIGELREGRPDGQADAQTTRRLRDMEAWRRIAATGDTGGYLDYLADGRGNRGVVADITPAYALLSPARLRAMGGLVPDTRFVFLMRDPVDRFWSHVRMLARRAVPAGSDPAEAAERIAGRALAGQEPDLLRRGAYDEILPRLKSAVPAGRLYVDIFEDVVPAGSVARLCAFLGISPRPARDRRPHSGVEVALGAALRGRIRSLLMPQYDHVRSELGRLPAAWEHSLAKEW